MKPEEGASMMQLSTEEESNCMLLYLKFYLYRLNASLPVGWPTKKRGYNTT